MIRLLGHGASDVIVEAMCADATWDESIDRYLSAALMGHTLSENGATDRSVRLESI